ncbi:MAG TPA: hypothetical protein VGV37_24430 [Aliidongia sp.]|uniref:hypothetical protein n=1 Tax=Aliidongia sp. TaxID=1914230 RepID=UPI002DDD82CE|nr:hypothetical protein [Aliidongia sp.]HEV2677700.1 hypothetical protein [Aliidongia sp.]
MTDPFDIEPDRLARMLVLLELDGIVWDEGVDTHRYLAQHSTEVMRALVRAGYRGPGMIADTHLFDDLRGQRYWIFNPERFNASSARAWVARQVRGLSKAPKLQEVADR